MLSFVNKTSKACLKTLLEKSPIVSCACLLLLGSTLASAAGIEGLAVDINGNPVSQAQISYRPEPEASGADLVTVFTDMDGAFRIPGDDHDVSESSEVLVRALNFQTYDTVYTEADNTGVFTFILEPVSNQEAVAPASAWLLERLPDRQAQSKFIMDCIDCHQVPAPEVRAYAAAIDDIQAADPARARHDSWNMIVKYMNFLSVWEFGRGARGESEQLDTEAVYSVNNGEAVAEQLSEIFPDRLDHIEGYDWGAPNIATKDTVVWEYEVPGPNAVREAVLLGNPARLFVADVAANRLVAIDVATGEQKDYEVPSEVLMSPHSLHRGADGTLWVTPLFNSIVAQLNPGSGVWRTWTLRTDTGQRPGIHDLSFGDEHVLLTDVDGNIWFSDIGNTAVGYFNPTEGNSRIWPAPQLESRSAAAALYGLVMTGDRREVWYSQLGNGVFGGFDIEKKEYIGPFALPDPNSGPRRITISDDDVMYMALYGSGQLAEFDIKSRKMIAIHDLPDTASAPYSATWDPVRKVVWIPTSNGDVIYRFDPESREMGVLPLPHAQSFLRMLDIDPETGVLITSNGNIVDIVNGPRVAMIIEPGDGAYPGRFELENAVAPTPED